MFQSFDRRYVINLAERTDRRSQTEAELTRIGATAHFHPAKRPATAGQFSSIGEHGCYLSHLAVWTAALGCDSLLVMEDDVAFDRDLSRGAALLDALPPDWDILYLGHMQHPAVRRRWTQTGIVPVSGDVEFIGAHCYAVSGRALPRLLSAAQGFMERERDHPDGGIMPIDGAINIARRQQGLITYAFMPAFAHQRASRTDIGKLKWFDRQPALSGLLNLARRAKDRVQRG